jgi:hypothetical protein
MNSGPCPYKGEKIASSMPAGKNQLFNAKRPDY